VTGHNVRETLAVTDRAYIINNGRVFRAGKPRRDWGTLAARAVAQSN
jgi:ABC-type lipopolysaccharide export system ATPase subunit